MARRVNYHQPAFWEDRYKQNVCEWFEWLAPPNQFNAILKERIGPNSAVLELGCGSSNLAQKLTTFEHQVTCLDFSKEIIKSRSKTNSNSKITYKLHNIMEKLPFEDGSFDLIIQKNTIDCLFCHENFVPVVLRTMKECFRVLKPNGSMISITHGKEKNRKFFYRNRFCPFNVQVHPLPNRKPAQAQVLIFILSKEGAAIEEAGEHSEAGSQDNNERQQENNVSKQEEAEKEVNQEKEEDKLQSEKDKEQKEERASQKQQEQKKSQGGEQEQYEFDQLQNEDDQDQ